MKASSSSSSRYQFSGIQGPFVSLLVLAAGAALLCSLYESFLAGLEEDHRADGQLWGHWGTLSWSLHLPRELPNEKTITREEAESFVHLGLVQGHPGHLSSADGTTRWLGGAERGADCRQEPDAYQGLQGDCTESACFLSDGCCTSQVDRCLLLLSAESMCV